jgi:hypothetical protein
MFLMPNFISMCQGVIVSDTRDETTVRYKAIDHGSLSLAKDGIKLDQMKWLLNTSNPFQPSQKTGTATRVILILLGAVLILWAIIKIIKKNKKNSNVIFLVLCCLPLFNACSQPNTGAVLVPKTIDIGNVRVSDSPVKVDYILQNTGNNPVKIHQILADCGCTVVETAYQYIPVGLECLVYQAHVSFFYRQNQDDEAKISHRWVGIQLQKFF